jgi:hypothetical protein
MRKLVPILGLFLLTAAACSTAAVPSPTPTSPTPGSPGPTSTATPGTTSGYSVSNTPDGLILRIETGGGFVAPSYQLTRLPEWTLFGDGRVIVPAPAVGDAPFIPKLAVLRVTPAEIQKIVGAADEAGLLGPDADYPIVGVADAGTTVFTTVVAGKVHRVSAYALGLGGPGAGGPAAGGGDPAVAAARAKLAALRDELSDLATFLGRTVPTDEAYVPLGLRVFLTDAGPADPSAPAQTVTWPLSADPATAGQPTAVPGTICVAVTGADAVSFTAAAKTAAATPQTVWTFGKARYTAGVRPMLPNETGCAGSTL